MERKDNKIIASPEVQSSTNLQPERFGQRLRKGAVNYAKWLLKECAVALGSLGVGIVVGVGTSMTTSSLGLPPEVTAIATLATMVPTMLAGKLYLMPRLIYGKQPQRFKL